MAGMFYLEIKYDHINDRHVFNRVVVTRVRDLSTLLTDYKWLVKCGTTTFHTKLDLDNG